MADSWDPLSPADPVHAEKAPRVRAVVVLDTDPGVRWALEHGLQRAGYQVHAASTLAETLTLLHESSAEALVLEILPDAGLTLDTLAMLCEQEGDARIVCTSVDSDPHVVIEAMRHGAADFIPKPFSLSQVRTALKRVLAGEEDRLPPRRLAQRRGSANADESLLIGVSAAMQKLRDAIEQVGMTDLNCLIRGESGTGKDMAAREIHRMSGRSGQPFIKVNCTALPDQLLESELFGYEKGAFTGAVSSKPGRFELAHNGMIFLDEIGDMDPNLQSKLLQVIEHKEFTKLGGTHAQRVDVQIIAATNADLEARTRDGSFRSDLYFRLNEVCLWMPSLKERKEDIPLLVRHFIQKHGRYATESLEFSGEDLASLTQYDWPGNVRELESTIKRWLAMGKPVTGPVQATDGARHETSGARGPAAMPAQQPSGNGTHDMSETESPEQERERILDALERFHWNRRKAAGHLNMSYQTLRRRIDKYGLNR